jgi:Domain of unknown function (DUF4258)
VSDIFRQITALVSNGELRISEHGYDELAADGIFVREIISGLTSASLLEDYPDFHKGPSVLVLEVDRNGYPLHVVWGIPKGENGPAVLVTAYRPDPTRWTPDFKRRKK